MDEKTKKNAEKAKADRAKFESIKKVEINPVITRSNRKLTKPDLRSPDEKQGKWRDDPEDLRQERLARKAESSSSKKDKA